MVSADTSTSLRLISRLSSGNVILRTRVLLVLNTVIDAGPIGDNVGWLLGNDVGDTVSNCGFVGVGVGIRVGTSEGTLDSVGETDGWNELDGYDEGFVDELGNWLGAGEGSPDDDGRDEKLGTWLGKSVDVGTYDKLGW